MGKIKISWAKRPCLFQRFPSKALAAARFFEHIGGKQGGEHGDEHTDETVEQEARFGAIFRYEHSRHAAHKARKGCLAADARHEDAHQEQTAQAAREQTEDFLEEVEERKYFPRGHEQGDGHADDACRHSGPPRHAQHFPVARLRAAALVEVDAERRGNGVDV